MKTKLLNWLANYKIVWLILGFIPGAFFYKIFAGNNTNLIIQSLLLVIQICSVIVLFCLMRKNL